MHIEADYRMSFYGKCLLLYFDESVYCLEEEKEEDQEANVIFSFDDCILSNQLSRWWDEKDEDGQLE